MNEPVIKWSGSKRSQAKEIIKYIPDKIEIYYEPFCGGASILKVLLNQNKNIKKFVCSDINNDLINLWNYIKLYPKEIKEHYLTLWNELNKDEDLDRKKEYFNYIRKRFNKYKNPLDFMFIMRTTTNGMPRYNKNGEFNNSFHISRNGINPSKLNKIIDEWSFLLNRYNVDFLCCSYDKIIPNKKDFMYLDPPYYNTKGMYYGKIDYDLFFCYLKNVKCSYILSFDGKNSNKNNIYEIPEYIYDQHKLLYSGKSSFRRIVNQSNEVVYESLYIKNNN